MAVRCPSFRHRSFLRRRSGARPGAGGRRVPCGLLRTATVAAVVGAALALVPMVRAPLAAQPDRGVTLSLQYEPGQRIGIMVLPVAGAGGDSVQRIVERDLDFSDRFLIVPGPGLPVQGAPNYALAQKAGAVGIVQAQLLASGWLRVQLHDVTKQLVVQQRDFPLPTALFTDAWRLGVHAVSDQVEAWATGAPGIAATRLAFVRDGRVWVVDSDGANPRAVTPRGLSPTWHPDGRQLVYSVLEDDRIRLAVTDLVTGAQRSLTNTRGTNDISPAVSPDGRTVAFARSTEQSAGGTDLFTIPFGGGTPVRVSVGRGRATTSPSWSPDGRRLVFNSDRSGASEIYLSDASGTNVELLTADAFGERNVRLSPDWSPDGTTVAYQSLLGRSNQILTLNLRDRVVRQVTSDGRNDDPSWAPDGRHLVFTSTRGGTAQLWIVDVETGRTRQLTRGATARMAAWSPRLAATP